MHFVKVYVRLVNSYCLKNNKRKETSLLNLYFGSGEQFSLTCHRSQKLFKLVKSSTEPNKQEFPFFMECINSLKIDLISIKQYKYTSIFSLTSFFSGYRMCATQGKDQLSQFYNAFWESISPKAIVNSNSETNSTKVAQYIANPLRLRDY